MIGSGKLVFIGNDDKIYDVEEMPSDLSTLKKDIYYIDLVSLGLYRYIGEATGSMKDIEKGAICKYGDRYLINRINETDPEYEEYSIDSVMFKDELDLNKKSIDSIVNNYLRNFKLGCNKSAIVEIKLRSSGDVYVPELKDTDDVLTRLMKIMIIRKKIILNNYKGKLDKEYSLDNLRSALNGTTESMTIKKFLDWCKLLDLYWKFELRNDPNVKNPLNPLDEPIVIAKDRFLWEDFGKAERGIFKVPCAEGDDPLKRLIKVAVMRKYMIPSNYKDKGSSPHLLNNMMSALKRKSKMMITYFVYWCEFLDLEYEFTLIDEETGMKLVADRDYKSQDYIQDDVQSDEDYD